MRSTRQRRRDFLKLATSAMAAPALCAAIPRRAQAQAKTRPLRFLVLYNSLGVPHEARADHFVQPNAGPLGQLKTILSPLSSFKDHLMVVTGCDLKTAFDQDVGGHPAGTAQGLTGTKMIDSGDRGSIRSRGPSIDVAIGEGVQAGTAYASLQLNVGGVSGNGQMCGSFGSDGRQRPRIRGAQSIYNALFENLAGDGAGPNLDPTLEVLNYVVDRTARIRQQLAGEGRARVLEAYRDSAREVAAQIEAISELSCDAGNAPGGGALDVEIRQTLGLVRNVFTCDLSRSVFLDVGGSSSRIKHTWMSQLPSAIRNAEHHGMSHDRSDAAFRNMCLIRAGFAELYADFLTTLENTPDGDGSLLDNTVILWATETASGAQHRLFDMPMVIIAGKNSGIRQGGHHVVADERPINDLHTALLKTFGLPSDTFGDPAFNNGPIDIF